MAAAIFCFIGLSPSWTFSYLRSIFGQAACVLSKRTDKG